MGAVGAVATHAKSARAVRSSMIRRARMSRYLFLHRTHPVDAPLPIVGQLSSGRLRQTPCAQVTNKRAAEGCTAAHCSPSVFPHPDAIARLG